MTGIFPNGNSVNAVNWSPDGQYVAIGGPLTGGYENAAYQFQIFQFNRMNNSLTAVAGALSATSDELYSVNWSPDGQYVAVGGNSITDGYENAAYQFQIFQFNRTNNSLTPVAGALNAAGDYVIRSIGVRMVNMWQLEGL